MSETTVVMDIAKALHYIGNLEVRLIRNQEERIEEFIKENTKPKRKGWFRTKPEVTREDAIKKLDEIESDDMFGKMTYRVGITWRYKRDLKRLHKIKRMCMDSADTNITLCHDDYVFITDL